MNVKLRQISGLAMAAVSDSNHWVSMDGPEEFGGFSAGSRPMELMLMGLAGCTAMDVVSILRKKRVKLSGFSLEVEAKQADEHPKIFTRIVLRYVFTGNNLRATDLEKAIELSESKYCSATAMLRKSATITHDYEIIETDEVPSDTRAE